MAVKRQVKNKPAGVSVKEDANGICIESTEDIAYDFVEE